MTPRLPNPRNRLRVAIAGIAEPAVAPKAADQELANRELGRRRAEVLDSRTRGGHAELAYRGSLP